MKKNLLAIGLLAMVSSVQAQILLHVDNTARMYVSKGTLVYNGGGMQTKGDGSIENHGNVMVSGASGDLFRNLDTSGNPVVNGTGGGFVNKLNEENNYNQVNINNSTTTPVYTYGQLYIDGLSQANITGVVNQEFRQPAHGSYQQMGLPFYDKVVSSLSGTSGLGKTFNNVRRSGNDILYWDNTNVVSANLPNGLNTRLGVDLNPFSYFMVGGTSLNVSTVTRTLVGRPVASTTPLTLSGAGANVNFGANGNALNQYLEKYNTYLQDSFSSSGGAWVGNFGKNVYQYGNPYMTNLDLSQIAVNEANGDGNFINNIYGIRLEVQGVQFSQGTGGGSATYKYITYDTSGVPVNDVDYAMVRPLGTFVVKLKDNDTPQSLNLASLRRFNYYSRAATTAYSVTANKNGQNSTTVKQLGVIGLDANGNEVARTYYVVSPNTISGHTLTPTVQIAAGNGTSFGTFEEDALNGGYDNNNVSYWLYSNEANENNFKGKNIKLVNYNPNIVSFKFEIRENAEKVADGTHVLSAGEGFYYKKSTSTSVSPAVQNAVVTAQAGSANNGVEYDLYYGLPTTAGALATSDAVKKSRTLVVYNPDNDGYFVRFDPLWKNANIDVFDMSGKLVLSKKSVDASRDYNLDLAKDVKISYLVIVVSDKGEKVTTKIVK